MSGQFSSHASFETASSTLLVPQKGLVPNTTAYSICLYRAALLYSSAGFLSNSRSLLLHASPHTDLPKAVKKKKSFTSFGQRGTIACILVRAVCLRWLCGPFNASFGPCLPPPPPPPPPFNPPPLLIHRRHVSSSPSPSSHIDTGMQSKT